MSGMKPSQGMGLSVSWEQRKGLHTMASNLNACRYTSDKPTPKSIKDVPV